MKAILLLSVFLCTDSWSKPKNLQVWFLSPEVQTSVFKSKIKWGPLLSQSPRQCHKMGEFCFDPQYGLYKEGNDNQRDYVEYKEVITKDKNLESAKLLERKKVDCAKGSFFDIYCGQQKKIVQKNKSKLELWFDISSTMRHVDPSAGGKCHREIFLDGLLSYCDSTKVRVNVFTERIKRIDMRSRVCDHSGLNSSENILKRIKSTFIENLIIITDVHENDGRFITALKVLGAEIRGRDKPMYPSEMQREIKTMAMFCK